LVPLRQDATENAGGAAPEDAPPDKRLDAARRVMRHLPQTAWLKRNTLFTDHMTGGDAGLYDLLLNPRDRPYDIPALAAFLDRADLNAMGTGRLR
jgi:hypothetical protein